MVWLVILYSIALSGIVTAGEIKGRVSSEWLDSPNDILIFIEKVDTSLTFELSKQHPKMDQRDLTFIPHVLPIVVGTTVDFPNGDIVQHNVFSPTKIKKFDLGSYSPSEVKSITFDKPGKVALLCKIHPEMSAYIVVLNNPYFALTDDDGKYVIKDIPANSYKLSTWHKALKTVTKVVIVSAEGIAEIDFELVIGEPGKLLKLLK